MKNKRVLIITIAIVVLVGLSLLAIFLLIQKDKQVDNTVNMVYINEIPIGDSDVKVNIQEQFDIDTQRAKVIEISKEDHKLFVEEIIESRNLDMEIVFEERGVGYTWCSKDNKRCMIYDIYPETLSFGFMDNPSNLIYDVSNMNDPEEIWKIFQEDFLLDKWEYTNFNLERYQGGFTVTAHRSVDGIPFERIADIQYTDHIKFDSRGFLISGKILLLEYGGNFSVDLIETNTLGNIINSDVYPKQYVVDKSKLNIGNLEKSEDIDLHYPNEIHDIDECNATNIELVYVYGTRHNSKYITPVYKMNCIGEVNYQNQILNIHIFLYTNAITTDSIMVE
jgi:hypothetical protein